MEGGLASFSYNCNIYKLYNTFSNQNKTKESAPLIPYLNPHLIPLMAP